MTEPILVSVNGETREIAAGQNVTQFLTALDLPVDRVAVELNRQIVRRRDWEQTQVPAAALIEVVEFVGGG